MRVVIAGSSGLIGTSLVPALRQARHEVVRLVRRRPEAPDERGWDPPAGRLDEDALEGADAVVNLCGAGIGDRRWTPERKRVLLDSRLRPTSVLAEAVAQRGVATLVNASAVGFYGNTGQRPVTESEPPGDGFLADLVRQWEAATAPASDAGARVVLARSGPVLSPAGGLLGRLRPLFSFLLGAFRRRRAVPAVDLAGRRGRGTALRPGTAADLRSGEPDRAHPGAQRRVRAGAGRGGRASGAVGGAGVRAACGRR